MLLWWQAQMQTMAEAKTLNNCCKQLPVADLERLS